MPSPSRLPAGALKGRFDALLADDVRPMLGARLRKIRVDLHPAARCRGHIGSRPAG
ncbi:MAG TPA: hypothetical protein VFE19_05185 [Jatrophihabitantaceae bacterium]|jgi:hypothetical protein|nr:hypothetical protein [Jatrophihabitantaceae bacterium]